MQPPFIQDPPKILSAIVGREIDTETHEARAASCGLIVPHHISESRIYHARALEYRAVAACPSSPRCVSFSAPVRGAPPVEGLLCLLISVCRGRRNPPRSRLRACSQSCSTMIRLLG